MPRSNVNAPVQQSLSEAYITLRINIEFAIKDQGIKSIAVSSARRGEGRTTTAMNLAIAYANAHKKVALVDADLRNPSLHHTFGGSNNTGLSNALSGRCLFSESVRPTGIENLWVVTSGAAKGIGASPSELLASERMDALLEELAREFDRVVIDTPPLLGPVDAKVMISKSDGVLLVTEYGKVKRAMARQVKEELAGLKAKLIGLVLNKNAGKEPGLYIS